MGYKQPSSGLPFKQIGSSPAKQKLSNKIKKVAKKVIDPLGLTDKFDVGGYLKGEQGFIPDYKGNSTKKTVHKVAKKVVKHTAPKKKKGVSVNDFDDTVAKGATQSLVKGGKMGLKQSGQSDVKDNAEKKPVKKYTKVRKDLKTKPPYKKPVGPRATTKESSKSSKSSKPKVNWKQEYLKGGQKGLTGRAAKEGGTSINPEQKEVTRLQKEYRKGPVGPRAN